MRLTSLAFLFCAIGLAQPKPTADAYIERGKADLAFSGNVTIPHGSVSSTSGSVFVDAGYYASRSSLVGGEVGVSAASGGQSFSLGAHYRYLFQTRNPKLFPFVGVSPGLGITHFSGSSNQIVPVSSSTNTTFMLRGEAGVKYFVARNVAVEAAYNLSYSHAANVSFQNSSASRLVFGLAFTF